MRADIHYGQEQVAPLKGPNTDERDQSSPNQSHPACNTRPVHTYVPIADIAREALLRCQLIEQRFGLLQIARVEALCEPAVNRSKQFARFPPLALVAPEAFMEVRSSQDLACCWRETVSARSKYSSVL